MFQFRAVLAQMVQFELLCATALLLVLAFLSFQLARHSAAQARTWAGVAAKASNLAQEEVRKAQLAAHQLRMSTVLTMLDEVQEEACRAREYESAAFRSAPALATQARMRALHLDRVVTQLKRHLHELAGSEAEPLPD